MNIQHQFTWRNTTPLSRQFIVIFYLWEFVLALQGIKEAAPGPPSWENFLSIDSLFVFLGPAVVAVLFYYLFKYINKWIIFAFCPLFGIGFGLFEEFVAEPDYQSIAFLAVIWTVIIVVPYVLTRLVQQWRLAQVLVYIGIIALLAVSAYSVITAEPKDMSQDPEMTTESQPVELESRPTSTPSDILQ